MSSKRDSTLLLFTNTDVVVNGSPSAGLLGPSPAPYRSRESP